MYWIPLYELLESRGFTVYLVNARHVKNVPGRKSDVLDCQWLQQLMSYGLLSRGYHPADEICALRAISRQREMLLSYQSRHVQHMHKALVQMHIQLGNVITDVVGDTGQKILRAIIAGERDGQVLARFRNSRIRASEDDIAKSLVGNWREAHLFALKQAMALHDAYAERLAECDQELRAMLARLGWYDADPGKPKRRSHAKNAPRLEPVWNRDVSSPPRQRAAAVPGFGFPPGWEGWLCRQPMPWACIRLSRQQVFQGDAGEHQRQHAA